jgi:hypothetical protein
MQKAISTFISSAGVILLSIATALFLIDYTNPLNAVQPHDPIFFISVGNLFSVIIGIALVIALICLYGERLVSSAHSLLGFASSYFIIRISFWTVGCHSLAGFLVGFTYVFGINADTISVTADFVFGYLFIGSCLTILLEGRLPQSVKFQKMSCPSCGGHVKFPLRNLGRVINCPHCQGTIALRNPDEQLKIACFFCHGHIEFPSHALGAKIPCPHCKMGITLKEPT